MSTRSTEDSNGRRRNRGATEDALIAAAREQFSARGYAAATTRAIAARVGCSEALIQNYFGGKEGLLAAVLGSNADDVRARAAAFVERPPALSLAAEVRDTIDFTATLLRRGSHHVRILVERSLGEREFGKRFSTLIPRRQLCDGLELRFARDWPVVGDTVAASELVISMSFELGFVHAELLGRDQAENESLLDRLAPMITKALMG